MDLGAVLSIEKEYHLNECSVNGFDYWQYSRFYVIELISRYHDKMTYGAPGNERSLVNKSIDRMKRLRACIDRRNFAHSASDLFFVSGARRVWNGHNYENTIVDAVMELYPNSVLYEYSGVESHVSPAMTRNIIYDDLCSLCVYLKSYYHCHISKKEYNEIWNDIARDIKQPLREMCSCSGVSIDVNEIISNIASYYFAYLVYRKWYKYILRVVQPKAIILSCHYGMRQMVFTELAKGLSIPIIELQHGTCGNEHPAYNYLTKGYYKQIPDYFFVFSDYWKKQARFPFSENHIIAVGSPYSERKATEYRDCKINDNIITILFLSTANIGETLSDLAVDLAELLEERRYRIIYKMHPNEEMGWQERYPRLANSQRIIVPRNDSSNLYELFSEATYVVASSNTTAVYESLLFDLSVLIYYPYAMKEFRDLCADGYAYRFEDVKELFELVIGNTLKQRVLSFWESDALAKMKDAIDCVIGGEELWTK